MITRFHMVRHGPTHAKCMVGWSDLPADLSDTAALARLSETLPADAVVVSSDLRRAVTTADAIQGPRRRLPHARDLREMHFGDWEQQRWSEVDAHSPDHIRAFWEQPGDIAPPNGESWNTLLQRVSDRIDTLCRTHRGQDIIVVGHFGQILCQVQRAAGLTASEAFAHKIDNLSVTRIDHTPAGWQLGAINQIL
ncbi:histidine phosphatase family protein [Epibacterium sp. Ofav1-8]|uniref:histidine phosphatase family protein n=1 Tax=Epibacterium sp. Ofav1-8 TaxID=2917735 RepID=UPI001EF56841|nr:histidine phosphatase family protein [Epibacterium sp. Ofav1-8]